MLGFPDTIWGEGCLLYRVSKGGFSGRSLFRTPHGEKGVDYMENQNGGFSGRSVIRTPYGEKSVFYIESQKEGFTDARFSGRHMGRRVLTI